ncbi:unnamed protein product [Mytilus coruscus]|uniref:Uncharacterized protein n=1 Tax=Mytilus coruscus TaxID=42192 RepID=A0A6J8BLD5_MYTCO|nr:unnamed protein product [Mytilus coruscus]
MNSIVFCNNELFYYTAAGGNAGSCYYRSSYFIYNDNSIYEFCLTGCCGSTKIDGIKHCCKDAGAIIGIFFGAAAFFILIVVICALCRRRHRSDSFVIRGSNERDRLISPATPATQYPSAAGHSHYQSQGRYNYQQTNTTTGYIYPPQTGTGNIYSQQTTPNAPAYQI